MVNTLSLNNLNNYQAILEYYILKGGVGLKTLNSLANPENSQEAISNLKKIIEESKFNTKIPPDERLLAKIIAEAMEEDMDIEQYLNKFVQKTSSARAGSRVDTGFVIAKVANNPSYRPVDTRLTA